VGNIIEIEDPFSYIIDNGDITGVVWQRGNNIVQFDRDGTINVIGYIKNIKNHELRQLMIMWLALEHPGCLNFDIQTEEGKIRNDTQ